MADHRELSVMDWFWTMLIMCIPIVGIIMVFVWGFGSGDSRKNFARAILLWYVVAAVIGLIVFIFATALTCSSIFNSF